MWIKYLILISLVSHILATQVLYHASSSASASQRQQYSWKTSDLVTSANTANEEFHPLTFDLSSYQPKKTGSTTQILDPSTVRIIIIIIIKICVPLSKLKNVISL